jgi:hypothetical protein
VHALELVPGSDGRADPGDVLAALAGRFRCVPAGVPHAVRRLWLDTFDWRLHRAGLVLEQSSRSGASEISLAGPEGGPLTVPAGGMRWPAPASALAPGELRDRLERAAGIRALLPVARAVSSLREIRVLNGDGKTVARVTVDELAVTRPAPAQLPPRLVISEVRS